MPTFRLKMLAISATGFIGGLAGCVYALQVGFVTVEGVFNLTVPLFVIVMSVLGGRYHWLGPALGAVVFFTLQRPAGGRGVRGSQPDRAARAGGPRAARAGGADARVAVRPLVVVASAGTFAVLAIASAWGTPLTGWPWQLAGAAVAFLPVPRRRLARRRLMTRATGWRSRNARGTGGTSRGRYARAVLDARSSRRPVARRFGRDRRRCAR